MKSHYIIAGGGRVGEEIAKKFTVLKKPYVIIENNQKTAALLLKSGFTVIKGDAREKNTLAKANPKQAKALILTLPETEINLLIMLLVKELNPAVQIYARADNPEYIGVLEKAGAKTVVVPELAAVEQFIHHIT